MLSRRGLLKTAGSLALAPHFAVAQDNQANGVTFPKSFFWGASTAAYQVEGAANEDGRGPSIWDEFARQPGKVINGDTGDVACDHYHRWPEDVALMKEAGFSAYRFSVAWPRVLPDGSNWANPKGLDFYDRLVDGLLEAGIRPFGCLYHWDLPQALQERGGWHNRAMADWFAEYAMVVGARLGDRVKDWMMLNEPSVVALFGHGLGSHAPGLVGRESFFKAIHHQNLAQGAAMQALRGLSGDFRLGTVLNLQPAHGESERVEDQVAAEMWDAAWNRCCIDPLVKGTYPDIVAQDLEPLVKANDLNIIRQPVDILGVNYYSDMVVKAFPDGMLGATWGVSHAKRFTDMGWPVNPQGLYDQLVDIRDHYGNIPVFISENGAAYNDVVSGKGVVADPQRIAYLRDHILAVHKAMTDGCDVRGYMVWSLLDNYEWAFGYSKRFGIVYVDYPTQRRIPKASYSWLADVAKTGRVL